MQPRCCTGGDIEGKRGGAGRERHDAGVRRSFRLGSCKRIQIFELALGIGQRPRDLVNMRWSDWARETGEIRVVRGKTSTELRISPTDTLLPFLEAAFRDAQGLTIVAAERTG